MRLISHNLFYYICDQLVAKYNRMPQTTFFNLQKKRREEIIHACFEEFAQHDYKNASVSRIVRRLRIAKGSFYRYFESKKDLYQFLLDRAIALRMEHVKEIFELPAGDFFSRFEQHLTMQIKFDLAFPLQSAFLHNSLQERNNEASSHMLIRSSEMMIELLTPVIEKYKKAGMLRTDIRNDSIVHLIMQIQLGVNDYLKIQSITNSLQSTTGPQYTLAISDQEVLRIVKELSSILALGLAQTEK